MVTDIINTAIELRNGKITDVGITQVSQLSPKMTHYFINILLFIPHFSIQHCTKFREHVLDPTS